MSTKITGAACLAPGDTTRIPDASRIDHIRAEVTHLAGCAHPVSCDASLGGGDIGRFAGPVTVQERDGARGPTWTPGKPPCELWFGGSA